MEVGQAEQRLGADHDGEVAFELGQGRGGEVLQLRRWGERVVNETEAQTRAGDGVGRARDGGRRFWFTRPPASGFSVRRR
ncbi:hypothetical protein ABZU76_26875 [Amycolatopsis sp. NPDC005232]|uniref:hypothetical protein n=1 Tax=Amycolatopsis sp. NPDC005232 TaxID=3157027 RepID=UPI0033AEF204